MARVSKIIELDPKQRKDVDQKLIAGHSLASISRLYDVSEAAVSHYRDTYLGLALSKGADLKARNHGVALLESLDELVCAARRVLNRAEEQGHSKVQLSAIKESRSSLVAIAQLSHLMWQQKQKEEQLVTVEAANPYITEAWHKNFKRLPKAERETFQNTLLKCLHSTGPTHYHTEDTPEDQKPEKVSYPPSPEAHIVDIEDISDRPMKRSSLKKPK